MEDENWKALVITGGHQVLHVLLVAPALCTTPSLPQLGVMMADAGQNFALVDVDVCRTIEDAARSLARLVPEFVPEVASGSPGDSSC